jgi:hypothetical protein
MIERNPFFHRQGRRDLQSVGSKIRFSFYELVLQQCYYAIGPILKRSIYQSIKIRLHKTIIRPTVMYGAEAWTLISKIEKNVNDMGEKDTEENIWTNKVEN